MKGKLFQLQTALACSFGQTTMGMLGTWPSYTLSILSSNETTPLSEPMTTAEESLLGSLPSLGAMAGTPIVGILIDKLGRRNGGILLSLPMVILCWVIVSLTTSKTLLLAARFLGGIAGGGNLVYAPIYISEVAEDSFRGTLASAPTLLYCLGTFFSYTFGWTLSYQSIVWVNLAFSIILVLSIMSLVESPLFLLKQNKDKEALAAIAHYRGVSPISKLVLDEMTKLKQQLMTPVELISVSADEQKAYLKVEEAEKEKLNTENVREEQKNKSSVKILFSSPSSRRAFLVVTTVLSLQLFMGIGPVLIYAKKVFEQSDPAKADLYSVILALVLTSGCMVPTVIADMVGRRVLIITSSALTCACLGSIAYLFQSGAAPPWVTVLIIMLYCFIFMSGAGSVPYILVAEVFTPEVQNLASTIIIQWGWFLNFVIVSAFPYLNNLMGIHGSFYCFALVAITNSIISFFIVPETKGLPSDRIQELMTGRKKREKIAF